MTRGSLSTGKVCFPLFVREREEMMQKDTALRKRMEEEGFLPDTIRQYEHYCETGDRRGQERMLNRCCGMKREELSREREKLACLDYMIAKLENSYGEER